MAGVQKEVHTKRQSCVAHLADNHWDHVQVNLRLLNASKIAESVAMLTAHADKELAAHATHLAGTWRDMAISVQHFAQQRLSHCGSTATELIKAFKPPSFVG